ncbi:MULTISPECIES: hypothetical protein [unclassified Paenibacillus]
MFNIEMAEKLKVLGDKTRLTIMGLLKDKEWCGFVIKWASASSNSLYR